VKGTIGSASSSTGYERELTASTCTVISTANPVPEPLGMNTREIGGTAFNAQTPGVHGGIGLNNLGLLVRIAGKVTRKYTSYFYVDDGCGRLADGSEKGIRVSSSATGIAEGDMVMVTGILGGYVPAGWSQAIPMIKTRSSSDVRKL